MQFFNGKGEHLFDIPGRTVEPNEYDPINTFDLQRNDHKTVVYRMDGNLLYPEDPEHAQWTDGQRVILWKEIKGALPRFGVIDKSGNELIPFEFSKITPVPSMHHFVAWFQHSDNYLESKGGVFGEKGEVIIPINHHEITAMDGCYLVHDLKKDKKGIYGGKGEIILPVEYHFSSAYDRIKHKHSDKYGVVTDQNTYETFLVSKNGQIFRPVGSVAVSYFSDIHPFIVEVKPDNGSIVRKYKLVNESGIERLPADYTFLEVTSEPSVFIGAKEPYGKKGLIDINAPQKTEFKYANTSQMDNGIFYGKTDDGVYEIFNKKLGKIFEGKLSYIKQPQKEHFEKFRSDWQCKNEKMVVVIRTPEMQGSEWAGISENGCVSYFKETRATKLSEKDKVDMAKTENLDVTHEKEILEELPGTDAAEPLKSPEVSPERDPITDNEEIFTTVEQMPEFPGGDAALYGYLAKNLIYPNIARENGIQGRVIASFIVEKDGSISNIQIVRGIGGGCQEEVLRLISTMPKWKPAKHQGVVVRCKSTFPVKFSLN